MTTGRRSMRGRLLRRPLAEPCPRQGDVLAALADRRQAVAAGAAGRAIERAALDHLDRCDACRTVLAELLLTVVALERLGDEAAIRTAGSDPRAGWLRLRQQIELSTRRAREQAWRWRTTLVGLATSALVVAALVGPATVRLTAGLEGGEPSGYNPVELEVLHRQVEAAYVSAAHVGTLPPAPADSPESGAGLFMRNYPDGIRPVRKEVQPARETVPAPDAR